LDSDGKCGVGALSKMDPLLGKLVNNGGPTVTHALLTGSPAIDAADTAMCPSTDQRGWPRPDLEATACDVGAFEFQVPAHFYKNHVGLAEESGGPGAEGTDIMAWGKLVLATKTAGVITCQNEWGGDVYNPVGGGAGEARVDSYTAYDCTNESCEVGLKSKQEIVTEGLAKFGEWESKLFEPEPGIIRLKIGNPELSSPTQMKFEIACPSTGLGEIKIKAAGELRPKIKNGTLIGSAPTKVEFGIGSGELTLAGLLEGKVEGSLKLMGYETGEIISEKKP
jgi:hypothetical protein